MKGSVLIYARYKEPLSGLTMAERGEVLTAILDYAGGEEPGEMSTAARVAYGFIKSQMDADGEKYEAACKARSDAGRAAVKARWAKEKGTNEYERIRTYTNEYEGIRPIHDNDNDNDSKEKEKEKETAVSIVTYLNQKTGKAFRASSEKTRTLIRARIREGYSEADFRKVIDNKCNDWLSDPERAQYLRPETLFGTKFESYLNQKPVIRTGGFRNFTERQDDLDADMAERVKKQHEAFREREQA